MAELLGIVASCLQLADTTLKLKRLWSEVLDGPKDIEELVQETIAQAEVLNDLHHFHQTTTHIGMNYGGWEKCQLLFKSSAEALERATMELDLLLTKHRRTGPVRLYLKKDVMVRCKERFQRAQMLMMTSQQIYFSLFASQNFSMILSEVRSIARQQSYSPQAAETGDLIDRYDQSAKVMTNRHQLSRHDNRNADKNRSAHSSHYTTKVSRYRFQLPAWILRKGFQIVTRKSYTGWTINLRTYSKVSSDSAVFTAANDGDWATVRKLFASHQASPFDIDPWGGTLLSIAARGYQIDACRMLIEQGLDPGEPIGDRDNTSVHHLAWGGQDSEISPASVARADETISLFAGIAIDSFVDAEGRLLYGFLDCPAPVLAIVIQKVFDNYEALDPLIRIEMAFDGNSFDLESTKVLLGQNMSLFQAFEIAESSGATENHITLLSKLSASFGELLDQSEYDSAWIKCLSDVVTFERGRTTALEYESTLMPFLRSYFWRTGWQPDADGLGAHNQYVSQAARIWIRILQSAGANLERYLVAERAGLSNVWRSRIESRDKHGREIVFRVHSLCGGAEPEDWSLFVVPTSYKSTHNPDGSGWVEFIVGHDEYEMSGAFWNWIENPELFDIPGSFCYVEDEGPTFEPVVFREPVL